MHDCSTVMISTRVVQDLGDQTPSPGSCSWMVGLGKLITEPRGVLVTYCWKGRRYQGLTELKQTTGLWW